MRPTLPPRSVRFRPNHAPGTPFTSKNALPAFGRIVERNDADRQFEVIFDLFFDFARADPVCEGKATVDFRFCGIFGRKEIVELFLRIDDACVRVAKLFRSRAQSFVRENATSQPGLPCGPAPLLRSSASALRPENVRSRISRR